MSGPFSVCYMQLPDETWRIEIRRDDLTTVQGDLDFKPEWIFKMLNDAYHFGEDIGKKRTIEKLEGERQFNKNRSLKERLLGIVCLLIGHDTWTGMDTYCKRCGTMFGLLKILKETNGS